MTKQPEALRIADALGASKQYTGDEIWQASAMLRRQHKAIQKLRGALIGVEPHFEDIDCTVSIQAQKALRYTEGL